jgi:polyisoprenyl-phosphate glycosyltransferase
VTSTAPRLSVVVPCYNEEEVLAETARRLGEALDRLIEARRIGEKSRVYFVDDGSVDRSWAIIEQLRQRSERFHGIKLSRNRGHQNALMAGLLTVPGDVVISIDADLQDDVDAFDSMLAAHEQGADVVYGVRSARQTDTMFKRTSAWAYYRLLGWMGVQLMYDHADFRLLSRRAIEALRAYGESNLFLRALIPQLGFKTAAVSYQRSERIAGTSKYPLTRMVSLGLDGITSFSIRPLRIIFLLGLAISVLSFALGIWALVAALVFQVTVPGWASTVVPIYFVCGVQMLCLGVIGEYIGKIYLETKRRPRFMIEHRTWSGEDAAALHTTAGVGDAEGREAEIPRNRAASTRGQSHSRPT